ncbi:SKA complex subunit 3 [Anarhichas minor]|uniref:SKA complex subunit 3 n=1 Tax=Anarhichas minor TaxID=65739 RepID=UPI003F731E6F
MDPTARFFTALRKLAVTLESETVKLQQVFENRNDDDSDSTAKAIRAYHEVNCDVRELKGQIQGQIAQQRAQENEVSSFIKACRVMEQKVSTDIRTLKGHWEKYGYQDYQRPTKAKDEALEAEDEAAEENEANSSTGGGGSQEEDGGSCSSSPPPPLFTDVLRTPQLSDFGLSEVEMKRALASLCSEVPPMPELSLPHPSLNTPGPPPHMALTPKRALRMDDDDELLTPQMPDFGLSEHTMCLNNDFTMDLFRKNVEKPQRPALEMPRPPVNILMEGLHSKEPDLVSPEPPVFYTPGFKIRKTNGRCSQPAQGDGDLESPPGQPGNLPSTPEVPVFQTPYLNRMATSRKSARKAEPINMRADDDEADTSDPPSPRSRATGSKRLWEYDVPDVTSVEDKQMPEMPNLESVLGNSLQTRSAKMRKKTSGHKKVTTESTVTSLELDGPTQEFSFGTPRLRTDDQEPSTAEMSVDSSVTQDICKLLTQPQLKRTAMAVVHPNVRPGNNKIRAVRLSEVSESEFQSLPKYLKQMTLHNLNQAVHNINTFTEESRGEQTEFRMEELRRICSAGTKTPVYVLCLTELRRLEDTGGARNTSLYRLCMLR